MYRTALLLHPARCYPPPPPPPPPPIFRKNYCIGLFYLHLRFAVLQFLHMYACCKCIRVYQVCRKYCLWPFSLISDGFLWPVILHVILPCSLAAGGRSLAARLPAMLCNIYMANNSSILQYCHGMSIERVLVFYRTTELR